jgi:hypothetical protein
VQRAVSASPSGYVDCATTGAYAAAYSTADPAYVAEVVAVRYWTGSGFAGSCAGDTGVQRVSVRVSSADGSVAESLDVIIRKPCRAGDDPCS